MAANYLPLTSRAWYSASASEFLAASDEVVLGTLAANDTGFALVAEQRDAWLGQFEVLRRSLRGLDGHLYLEFTVPRMGRRIDAVFLTGSILFVIEFKIGSAEINRAAIEQVWDYALDLKYFHEGSHHAAIVPIHVATELQEPRTFDFVRDRDNVFQPVTTGADGLRAVLETALATIQGHGIDQATWASARYRPSPTIVEAARTLFARHSVDAIARFDADTQNLTITSQRIEDIIDAARRKGEKVICFVTGVPGAGKTLVGLNIATRHKRDPADPTRAVFLSGNGPLVHVLREALTRDEHGRQQGNPNLERKGEIRSRVKSFIQNVHHFRDEMLVDSNAPDEHVAIFDEAQRAWNLRRTASFMLARKKRAGFAQSEPQFLVASMDRHRDWAAIICLVGGGQEINTGEAGIGAWLDAVRDHFPGWKIHISPNLTDSEYAVAGLEDDLIRETRGIELDPALHLSTSMRSFRSEKVSAFVKALLDMDDANAKSLIGDFHSRFPIFVTRDLDAAKSWVRNMARGSERFGLITLSKALRLKPHAIDVRVNVDPGHWFLNDRDDTRSSFYLEDAATEFQVQGLELDWTCVAWDGDLRQQGGSWSFHDFRGSRWVNIRNSENRNYLKNAYRVLLTRARQGMVVFVPAGNPSDPTRHPSFYDSTYNYLLATGISPLPG